MNSSSFQTVRISPSTELEFMSILLNRTEFEFNCCSSWTEFGVHSAVRLSAVCAQFEFNSLYLRSILELNSEFGAVTVRSFRQFHSDWSDFSWTAALYCNGKGSIPPRHCTVLKQSAMGAHYYSTITPAAVVRPVERGRKPGQQKV